MRITTNFQNEPFELIFENEWEFESELVGEAWESEVNRGGSAYIRWVQQSLNRLLGLQLAVDGDAGVKTRSAIRSFQQQRGLMADGVVGSKTEAALIAAGAAPPTGHTVPAISSAACPPKPTFVDCPNPGIAPTEVLDNFAFNDTRLNRPRHTPQLIKVAQQLIASQNSPQPARSILVAGHTDPAGSDDFNFNLARQRAEAVARELCATIERMKPGLVRQLKFNLTSCGERQQKATAPASRRVELFLPGIARPLPAPQLPGPPLPAPPSQAPPARVPSDLDLLIKLVQEILRGLMPVLGAAGVKLPTTARFLTTDEQKEAKSVFGDSLDFTKILISDGNGFQERQFTVAVPLSSGFHVVMLLGDVNPWHTRGRSHILIHELTHAWQSQHYSGNPTAFMQNSIVCQVHAIADVPIAKAEAVAAAVAGAIGSDPITLFGIGRAAAAKEDVSAYAYVPGSPPRPFTAFAAEQIAQQVEDGYLGTGRPTPVLPTIQSVGKNVHSPANAASLGVISFHRKSTPGVVFP